MTGVELIAEERKRQIKVEGWDEKHDDEHLEFDLSCAGACYALQVLTIKNTRFEEFFKKIYSAFWPWGDRWWKPTPNDPIRQLTKAGALIAAEIDRLQRQKEKESETHQN